MTAPQVCPHCGTRPEYAALCLVTGELLCSALRGCVEGRGGGLLHSAERCGGSTLLLVLKSTKVRPLLFGSAQQLNRCKNVHIYAPYIATGRWVGR